MPANYIFRILCSNRVICTICELLPLRTRWRCVGVPSSYIFVVCHAKLFAKYALHEATVWTMALPDLFSLVRTLALTPFPTISLSLSLSGLSSASAECLVSNRLPFNRIDRCQLIAQWNPSDYNDNYAAYDFLTRSLFLSSPARIKRRAVDKCLYTHQHTHTYTQLELCVVRPCRPFL